jgi:hypothetical protein
LQQGVDMKKIVAGLMLALAGITAQADMCIINPTSPRYHVDTYVRWQPRCVTTQHAGKAAMANPFLALAGVIIAGVHIANYLDWNKDEHKWIDYKVTWADETTDFIRVRSEEIDIKEGAQKLRAAFADSDNPIKSLTWVSNGKPNPTYVIQ